MSFMKHAIQLDFILYYLPAEKDFGLEFGRVWFNNLHLDQGVLLRPDSLWMQ